MICRHAAITIRHVAATTPFIIITATLYDDATLFAIIFMIDDVEDGDILLLLRCSFFFMSFRHYRHFVR